MKKDRNAVLSEYARNLSEEELKFLSTRLVDRISDDLAEALNFVAKTKATDDVFRSADSADDLYDLCDLLQETVSKECRKRNINTKGKKHVAA